MLERNPVHPRYDKVVLKQLTIDEGFRECESKGKMTTQVYSTPNSCSARVGNMEYFKYKRASNFVVDFLHRRVVMETREMKKLSRAKSSY